jgi:hypothetical protein
MPPLGAQLLAQADGGRVCDTFGRRGRHHRVGAHQHDAG